MIAISSLIALFGYACALCGIVPLFPWLGTGPRMALAVGMAAGVWQSLRGDWRLPNRLLNLAIVPVFLYYATQFSRSNAVQPVVSLLAVMLAVRLAGEKSGRHYLQILGLSLFCLASSSLFELTPLFLLYLVLLLLLVALCLVLLCFHDRDSRMRLSGRDLRRVMVAGLALPAASLPLLLFFFPLLPRTQIPLWDISGAPGARTSGLSDRVEPGGSDRVGDSSQLAFRAELPRQPDRQLYWRATVFNRLEGNSWLRDSRVPPERPPLPSRRVSQVIYPEPGISRFLIALDVPVAAASFRSRWNPDATVELRPSGTRRLSYRAESSPGGLLRTGGGIRRDFYLRLPARVPESVTRLANNIRDSADSDEQRVALLERFFRNGGFRYARQGLPTGERALERFLFETRQGHCEFFASSYALLARSAGIPARLVGGYLGGEYNELGGYYLVTEGMAHVWVEVFVVGQGWLRIDPSSFARNAGAFWGAPGRRTPLMRLRMALDSLDHAWNRSVIGYDLESQAAVARGVARRLGTMSPNRLSRPALAVLGGMAVLILALVTLIRRGPPFATREERLLRELYRYLERVWGVTVRPGHQGLFELSGMVDDERVREFVALYAGALYRDRRLSTEECRRLRRLLRFRPRRER